MRKKQQPPRLFSSSPNEECVMSTGEVVDGSDPAVAVLLNNSFRSVSFSSSSSDAVRVFLADSNALLLPVCFKDILHSYVTRQT